MDHYEFRLLVCGWGKFDQCAGSDLELGQKSRQQGRAQARDRRLCDHGALLKPRAKQGMHDVNTELFKPIGPVKRAAVLMLENWGRQRLDLPALR